MNDVQWIKLTTSMFDNEKIKLIESLPAGDSILIIWIKLLTLAGKTNEGGFIHLNRDISYTDKMISSLFNRKLNIITLALKTFEDYSMIERDEKNRIFIPNWEKHQNIDGLKKIREQGRLRQKTHREKQKRLITDNVTNNAIDNAIVTEDNVIEVEVEVEVEVEENNIPDSDESGVKNFYLTKKKKKLIGKRLETFNQFWNDFNFKHGKADAADSWLDIPQLTKSLVKTICESAKLEAENRPIIKSKGLTPKHAQGWLSSRRWEDEYETDNSNKDNGCDLPTIGEE